MRIGIIIDSTRPGRNGLAVGKWVHALASQRSSQTRKHRVVVTSAGHPCGPWWQG